VTSGAIPVRVAVRMTDAGNVVMATGTRATEIRTGPVAMTIAGASKMRTGIAIAIASQIRMRAGFLPSVASGMTRAVRLRRKTSGMAAGSVIRVVTRAKQTKPGEFRRAFSLVASA